MSMQGIIKINKNVTHLIILKIGALPENRTQIFALEAQNNNHYTSNAFNTIVFIHKSSRVVEKIT